MCLIPEDSCWVVHIPFVRLVNFQILPPFPVDPFAHPAVSSLELFLC